MKKILLTLGLLMFAAPAFTASAMAEVFVWTDPGTKVQASFPDNWMRQANLDDDLRLFVLAPQGQDHAACRMYISNDGRYKDAPVNYTAAVNQFVFTPDAIRQEVFARPDTNTVRVSNYVPNASLGKGAAVMADVTFTKNWAGQSFPMKGRMFALLYHGTKIVLSCEALESGWDRWEDIVMGVAKSVNFPAAWTPFPNSYYRRFQDDGGVILPLNRKENALGVF